MELARPVRQAVLTSVVRLMLQWPEISQLHLGKIAAASAPNNHAYDR